MADFFLSAWRAGMRSKSFYAVLSLGFLLAFVAYLSASFSPRQPQTVALDIGFTGLRICLVLLSVFWVQEFVGKEIERRQVLFSLTYPASRAAYLLGRYFAVLALSGVATLLLALLLLLVVLSSGAQYEQEFPVALGVPYWITVVGVWLDSAIVAAFALTISALSTVTALPIVLSLAFAVAGKGLGPALDYLAKGEDEKLTLTLNPLLNKVQWFLPDLSRLDWRSWPMYGLIEAPPELTWAVVMAVGYICVLLVLAVFMLERREFS
jgi:Cu-processing system permease protein